MSTNAVTTFIQQLQKTQLLDATQQAEVERLGQTATQIKELAAELVRRGWISVFQANQVARGRAADLILGSYLLLKPLAQGGMGQVFRARHRFMQREVALKFIRPEQRESQDIAQRFQREVELLSKLHHPHIVQAHDAGKVGDIWFLAMELLEGINLDELVEQQGPLPVGQACAYLRQSALGLHHAHERSLVHRDIKPSNLFLTAEGIKVLDLGLARPKALNEATQPGDLTRANSLMGTPDYLAPEQALDPRYADVRSDLYSLGCTLFFLLTGRPPFPEGTLAQKLLYHQQTAPPAVETLRPEVPSELAGLLRGLLAKSPQQRPASAADVAAWLAPFADAVAAGPPAKGEGKRPGPAPLAAPTASPAGAASLVNARAKAPERGFTLTAESLSPSSASSLVDARATAPERGFTLTTQSLPPSPVGPPPVLQPGQLGAPPQPWSPPPLSGAAPTWVPPAGQFAGGPPPAQPMPQAGFPAAPRRGMPRRRGNQARQHLIIGVGIIVILPALLAGLAALFVIPASNRLDTLPPDTPLAANKTPVIVPGTNSKPGTPALPPETAKETPKQTRPDKTPPDPTPPDKMPPEKMPPDKTPPDKSPMGKLFAKGPRLYLTDLEEFYVQAGPWPLGKAGVLHLNKLILVSNKLSPKGLSLHPPAAPNHAAVKYRLNKEAALFKTIVAVDDTTNFCFTPAVFTIWGDGKELWKSKLIAHNHFRTQECQVDVTGVDVLELRVHCIGHNLNVLAVFVEPRLLQNVNTVDP